MFYNKINNVSYFNIFILIKKCSRNIRFKIKISNHNPHKVKQKLVTAVKDFRVDYQAMVQFDKVKFLRDQMLQHKLLPFWLQNPEGLILNFQFPEELT